jgi:hypothetical protein
MLQDPKRVLLTTRSSKFEPGRFKIIALITLAVLALLSIISSRGRGDRRLGVPNDALRALG